MSKRKHSSLKDDGSSLVESVRRLEAGVLSSQNEMNNIVDIFNIAKADSNGSEAVFAALGSLGRVYAALWTKGLLTRGKDDRESAAVKVKDWLRENYNQYIDLLRATLQKPEAPMQVAALKLLLQMIEKEGESVSKLSGSYEFPNESYLRAIEAVLDNSNASEHLLRALADSYLNSYDDLRMYFYRDIAKIASPDYDPFKKRRNGEKRENGGSALVEKVEAFVQNTFAVMSMVRVMPKRTADQLDSLWVAVPQELAGKTDIAVLSPKAHKKAFSEAWLALMRQPLTADIFKQILQTMHKRIIPYMNDPRNLMDFLSNSYDAGGSVSLLALNGLFTLISEYNLNYPQFYEKLYALLDRNLFHVKYRARFFRLFELFLGSSHLPSYLVAAFIKRIARLSISAPPSGAVIAIPVIYNLLKDHPKCMCLIHRTPGYDEETGEEKVLSGNDPYLPLEPDLAKCMAIESSLWEIETLQNHYYPNIATLAKIFSEPFHKPKFLLEDFLDHTYTTFFESDSARKLRKAPALAAQPPVALMRAGDATSDFFVF
ncbi:Maturation and nuclear export of 40S ribosomal subunits interacting protein [Coemansia interrupta]|uniref:Maturation and nuclear export of 40S ribosomal subunits interacting protein n=1 Tax=Coemansia interrupta TaxID=1126814 RepID=A0A9W8LLX1_9FUNG|nr:Maturation and nuclear export of 40S ribosomal subunits interacting protein [Coemansia interrupta]